MSTKKNDHSSFIDYSLQPGVSPGAHQQQEHGYTQRNLAQQQKGTDF